MPNNKIDGIIKMSKEELAKSRKLVLDSIEEDVQTQKKEEIQGRERARSVDGVVKKMRNKIKDSSVAGKLKSKKSKKIQQKFSVPAPFSATNKKLESSDNKIIDIKQREKERAEKKEKKKEERKEEQKMKIEKAEQEKQEKERQRKKAIIDKAKAIEKKKKEILELRKKKIQAKEEKKKKQKERARRRKEALKNKYDKFITRTTAASKRTLFHLILFTVLFLLIYSLFAILLLKLNVDTKTTRYIARYLPVPAIIANGSVIEYYTYKDVKLRIVEMSGSVNTPDETVKLTLIKNLIVSNLIRKYNLPPSKSLIDDINKKIIYDSDANFVSITRIMKIKKLIDGGEDFIRTSTRLGDNLGALTINKENIDDFKFYSKLAALKKGENSNIVINIDGYYIYHVFRKTSDTTELSYAKINAKLLDDYLDETIINYKLWSLVD